MADLSHWLYANNFSGQQAAFLILGVDPSTDTTGLSCSHILDRLSEAYSGAFEALNFEVLVAPCLPDELQSDASQKLMARSRRLYSLRMVQLLNGWDEGDEQSIEGWLNVGVTDFSDALFSRDELGRWLSENGLPSRYQFALNKETEVDEGESEFDPSESGKVVGIDQASLPPYFDSDSDDYPQLLHIAVRAWEHARSTSGGTAKQRISNYVLERYPDIAEGTREAIALVANWKKAGGRPRTGG